jgi:serine protease
MAAGVSYADGSTESTTGQVVNHGWTDNPFHPAYDHPWRHGALPTREVHQAMIDWNHDEFNHGASTAQPTSSQGQLTYGGGVSGVGVGSGQVKVYLVFYGTQWGTQTTDSNGNAAFSGDSYGAASAVQQMFKGIGTNNETWQADLTQWCDGPNVSNGASSCPSNAAFVPYQTNALAGVWYDNSAASPASATGTQLAQEAVKAAAHFGKTATGSNRYTYYIILSPHGTNPDNYQSTTQGYCAWHDYTGDGYGVTAPGGDIAFSNQPYNMDVGTSCGVGFVNGSTNGKLDGYTMTLGHEWHEMMSDMFPAGGWTNHTGGTYNGQENSDECAWLSPGTAGGAANVTFSTGTFAEQASWSNDTGACAISHPILTHGGGGGTPVANFSFTTSGLTANFTDTSTDSGGTISAHSWNFGDGSTSTSTNPSHTYASAGTYTVTETVTDSTGPTNTATKSVTVTTTSTVLTNGVPVTGLAATTGNKLNYTMVVPAGATNLKFAISGGTGDADLYVKFGSAPTTSSYDCRPYVTGNSETCTITSIQAGTYYVMLNAYASFTGVTLTGSYTAPGSGGTPTANFTFTTSNLTATFTDTSTDAGGTIGSHSWNFGDGSTSTTTSPSHTYSTAGTYSVSETVTDSVNGTSNTKTSSVTVTAPSGNVLTNNVPITGLSGASGALSAAYTFTVPAGATNISVSISGGTGDADLYVKLGSAPTLTSYTCRPYITGNNETCTLSGAGTYYIKLNGYTAYSGVSLVGKYTP